MQNSFTNLNRVNRKTSHVSWMSSQQQNFQHQNQPIQQQPQPPQQQSQQQLRQPSHIASSSNVKTLTFFSVNSNATETSNSHTNHNTSHNVNNTNKMMSNQALHSTTPIPTATTTTHQAPSQQQQYPQSLSNNHTNNVIGHLHQHQLHHIEGDAKETRSVSSSSSSKFSSGSSSSVSPPLANTNTNTADANAQHEINQKNFNKFNNKIPFATAHDSSFSANKKAANMSHANNANNVNSWDNNKKLMSSSNSNSNESLPVPPLISNKIDNFPKNYAQNSYYPQQNQAQTQQQQQRYGNGNGNGNGNSSYTNKYNENFPNTNSTAQAWVMSTF